VRKKAIWGWAALALATVACSTAALAAELTPVTVTLRAGKADSPYFWLATQLVAVLNRPDTISPKLAMEESQGSVQNVIDAAQERSRKLFTAPPNVIVEARQGGKPYGKSARYQDIRGLFPIPFQAMHWVVRQDSNVTTFSGLAGRPFIPGSRGSFGERETTALLKSLNLDTAVQLIDIDSAGSVAAFKSQQVIGFATSGPYPIASLNTLAADTPLRLLSLAPDQLKQQLANDGTTVAVTIPKGTYPGVDSDVATVALPAGLYTTRYMSDAIAYRITKAFWTALPALIATDPVWQAMTPALLPVLKTRLHPGALRYYREIGVKLPRELG